MKACVFGPNGVLLDIIDDTSVVLHLEDELFTVKACHHAILAELSSLETTNPVLITYVIMLTEILHECRTNGYLLHKQIGKIAPSFILNPLANFFKLTKEWEVNGTQHLSFSIRPELNSLEWLEERSKLGFEPMSAEQIKLKRNTFKGKV